MNAHRTAENTARRSADRPGLKMRDLDRDLFRAGGIDRRRPPVKLTEVAGRAGLSPAQTRRLATVDAVQITAWKGIESTTGRRK